MSTAMTIKRLIDIVGAASALLVLSPLLLATMICIVLEDGFPIFFTQKRAGQNEREFDILKFRSMRVNTEAAESMGTVTGTHPLVTRTGRFIRRFKIDELPQIINVLKGDLSLVGPRPTLLAQVKEYSDFERRRMAMKPGMTGWAQVNGSRGPLHDQADVARRVELDVEYIERANLFWDLKIMLITLPVLLGDRESIR